MSQNLQAVLFDLDGTLIDSAPDLAGAVNALRTAQGLDALPLHSLRPFASHGALGLIQAGLGINATDPAYPALREAFLAHYHNHATCETQLFAGIGALLDQLDASGIPWGIITNKHSKYTQPVVAYFGLDQRAAVIVSGDTTPYAKPHPAPMHYAAKQLGLTPDQLIYCGDDERDIQAARAAGYARAIAIGYGYAEASTIPDWQADALAHTPQELGHLLQTLLPKMNETCTKKQQLTH